MYMCFSGFPSSDSRRHVPLLAGLRIMPENTNASDGEFFNLIQLGNG